MTPNHVIACLQMLQFQYALAAPLWALYCLKKPTVY